MVKLNSRAFAMLLAVIIASITTLFLSLSPGISYSALLITGIVSFSSSYALIWISSELLFFKEINNIYNKLSGLQDKNLTLLKRKSSTSINPLKDINKEIHRYVNRKSQEIDELKRMETYRREFLADVSHELKTPIFAAQGFVHTLLDGAVLDKAVRNKFLQKAAKSLDGLDILVQDLFAISQMERGEMTMHLSHFDIVDLTNEVFEQLEEKAEERKIELKFKDPHKRSIYVYADYNRIFQVLINLTSNAIKYTDNEGEVLIDFKVGSGKVTIMIQDNGIGIPKKDLNRIFERFYRVEKSRSKLKGGTGLGLSIVKHILEAHHSTIKVESKLGEGSKFWFKLEAGTPSTNIQVEEKNEIK